MKQAMSSVVLTVPRAASGAAFGKLPPLTEEQQIMAGEAKAKAVHAGRWTAAA